MKKMAIYLTALNMKLLIAFKIFHIYQMTFFGIGSQRKNGMKGKR